MERNTIPVLWKCTVLHTCLVATVSRQMYVTSNINRRVPFSMETVSFFDSIQSHGVSVSMDRHKYIKPQVSLADYFMFEICPSHVSMVLYGRE